MTINIDNNYVDGATVGSGRRRPANEDPIGSLDLAGSPAPGQVRVKGWAFDPNAPTEPLAIRAFVGGRAGAARRVELRTRRRSPTRPRPDVGAKYRRPGATTASTSRFPTVKSGPQPVCVYALNTGGGADRLLGCKSTTVPVAVTLSVAEGDARRGQGLGRLRLAGRAPPARGSWRCAPGSRSRSRTAAARRRGSAPSPARSAAAPSSSPASAATAS